jgi:hypothetical protein
MVLVLVVLIPGLLMRLMRAEVLLLLLLLLLLRVSLIEIVVQQRREHLASLQDLEASLHVERGELNLLDPIGEQQQQRRQRVVLLLVGDAHLVRVRVGVRG